MGVFVTGQCRILWLYAVFSTSSREKAASYLVPIRDTRLNSSRLRFQKPGGAINLLVHCIAERLEEGRGVYGSMGIVLLQRGSNLSSFGDFV